MIIVRKTLAIGLISAISFVGSAFSSEHGSGDSLVEYAIDPVHSGITFKIRHFFTNVPGSFGDFEGTLWIDESDMTRNKVKASIKVAGVHTHNEKRDEHLRSDDFFDDEKYPVMEFVSTGWVAVNDSTYTVTGDLTMLGKTKSVTLTAHNLGFGENRNGVRMNGWTVTGKLKRSDWGMNYGIPVIGDEVEFEISVQAHKQ